MPNTVAALTGNQVAGYAVAAGFSGEDVRTITAIAKAESGWNARAHNPVPPDDSYGLTQINMRGDLGPSRRKAFGLKSNDDLYDPAVNMRAAYAVYKAAGNSFRPWSTYNNGSYKKWLSISPRTGDAPTITEQQKTGVQILQDGYANLTPWSAITNEMNKAIETFRQAAWLWLVIVIALTLLILGIVILNKERALRIAKTVTPVGRVAKVIGA